MRQQQPQQRLLPLNNNNKRITENDEEEEEENKTTNNNAEMMMEKAKSDPKELERLKKNPIEGYPPKDLGILIPVAIRMEREFETVSYAERLERFIDAPELQEHWVAKDMERNKSNPAVVRQMELIELGQRYDDSRSQVEKDSIKSDMDAIEEEVQLAKKKLECTPASFLNEDIGDMSMEELELRRQKLRELPRVLQFMFLMGVPILEFEYEQYDTTKEAAVVDSELEVEMELGILIEHWYEQLLLIHEIPYEKQRLSKQNRRDAVLGYQRLPLKLQVFLQNRYGVSSSPTAAAAGEQVIATLEDRINTSS